MGLAPSASPLRSGASSGASISEAFAPPPMAIAHQILKAWVEGF
jgi:hypothetical protein